MVFFSSRNTLRIISTILFVLLAAPTAQLMASDRDRMQFIFQPNPRDELQKYEETPQIRIAQQYGLGYLPLMVMRQYRLIEKNAQQYGLGNVRVNWVTFPSGERMNKALETGFLDIASGGVVPMVSAWDRTHETTEIRGVAALSAMPIYLNARNPNVKRLADFTDSDRIALPAPQTSFQAVILQMAAAAEFGRSHAFKLDKQTFGLRHPDAANALIAGDPKVTAHFASPPYQYLELAQPGIQKVLSSYDVLGGPATFTLLWASEAFVTNNPHTTRVIVRALNEAISMISRDPQLAATTYIQQGGYVNATEEDIIRILKMPENTYSSRPLNVTKVADFMYLTGKVKNRPGDSDLFFSGVQGAGY